MTLDLIRIHLGIVSVALLTGAPETMAQQTTTTPGFVRVAVRTQMELVRPTTGASKVLYKGPSGSYLDKQTAAPGLEFAAAREATPGLASHWSSPIQPVYWYGAYKGCKGMLGVDAVAWSSFEGPPTNPKQGSHERMPLSSPT